MTIILTGAAGFIGSCMLHTLNDEGVTDIIVVDNIASTGKWLNLCGKRFQEYAHKDDFLHQLDTYHNIDCVIHLGACSDTTQMNFDYLYKNNVQYSTVLWRYCARNGVPFIYASSAATYGDGSKGFNDETPIQAFLPLNGYGYSKQLFDLWAERQTERPPQYVGLKFFNVYGPNEYFKGSMASMVYHGFKQIQTDGYIRLFRSYHKDYNDGGQLRDFIYVKDVCKVVMFFLRHKEISGLFNVGTGRARSFVSLVESVYKTLGGEPNIRYIDMPEHLKEKYQYYTCAEMNKLKKAGYTESFMDIEAGVRDYVENFLCNDFLVY